MGDIHLLKPPRSSLLLGMAIVGALFLNVANAFLLLCCALYVSLKGKHNEPGLDVPGLLMLALAGWITLSQFWSGTGSIGWFTTWTFLAIPLAFFVWQGYSRNQPDSWLSLQILLALLGCVVAIWGIAQVTMQGFYRATGPVTDANTYACLLNLLWFPLFARFVTTKDSRIAMLSGFALSVIHLAMMMSGSRAASLIWLLLCAGLTKWLWKDIIGKRLLFIGVMATANYFIYTLYYNHLDLSSYGAAFDLLQSSQPSELPRLMMWQSTIRMWLDAPWLGSGLGSWNYLYPMYRIPAETGTAGYYAHNDYLQILQEGGVFTLLVFVGVMGWLGFYIIKTLGKLPSGVERIENSGIVAGIAAATMHAFVNFTFYLIYINILIGIYLGKLIQSQGMLIQERAVSSRIQVAQLKKTAILILIAVNGFHAVLSSTGLALLRDESLGGRIAHFMAPQLNPFSVAALLSSIRPSDALAQRYMIASMENGVINNLSVSSQQAREMFNEIVGGYELLRSQNPYDAAIPANEAGFLISFDKRYGDEPGHIQRARELLQESLQKYPFRADSAILLAETYFIEGQPQEAFNLLTRMSSGVWREREKMMIEAEILKHKAPEYANQLTELQQELREMRGHCMGGICRERNMEIERSARQTLDNLKRKYPG